MNGKTNIDPIMNPCSAEIDKRTYGCSFINVCFRGRIIKFTVWRLTIDIHDGLNSIFTSMGGGANGSARYWMLFLPFGSITFVTKKAKSTQH